MSETMPQGDVASLEPQGAPPATVVLPPVDQPVVARAGRYYRNTRYIIVLAALVMAGWFLYDGYIAWPKENEKARQEKAAKLPHPEFDIWLQKVLGFSMPPIGLTLLAFWLARSRGQYKLAGDMLSVPGHAPIPLSAIRKLDKRKWDRKGIAIVHYEVPNTRRMSKFKLDDFVYAQKPIDRIIECIEAHAPNLSDIIR